ncbi:MAG: SDR family oxidoreductase [Desulfarculus sp.]|jgi:2-deoxy-D-gluconate 3-dehydrogenase|nr:MAG: SDR family oxidoreductase [Desulfarculus sp.]
MGKTSYGLEGKVALVTGGSRGIGLATAKRLREEGAQVAICGRRPEGLQAAAAELGGEVLTVAAHIAKEDQVQALFQAVRERFGRLDVLINNVGMNLITPSLADTDPGLWQKIIDSNLNGNFLCSRLAAQIMKGQGGGKIVSISSVAGRRAAPFMGVYGIAKAGIEMMTKVLAVELASCNIQVNAVAPAMVKTDFSKPFWSDENVHKKIVASIPAGRLAEPLDVVHPVLFLASAGADYITGQTLVVDGGASVA